MRGDVVTERKSGREWKTGERRCRHRHRHRRAARSEEPRRPRFFSPETVARCVTASLAL